MRHTQRRLGRAAGRSADGHPELGRQAGGGGKHGRPGSRLVGVCGSDVTRQRWVLAGAPLGHNHIQSYTQVRPSHTSAYGHTAMAGTNTEDTLTWQALLMRMSTRLKRARIIRQNSSMAKESRRSRPTTWNRCFQELSIVGHTGVARVSERRHAACVAVHVVGWRDFFERAEVEGVW